MSSDKSIRRQVEFKRNPFPVTNIAYGVDDGKKGVEKISDRDAERKLNEQVSNEKKKVKVYIYINIDI